MGMYRSVKRITSARSVGKCLGVICNLFYDY